MDKKRVSEILETKDIQDIYYKDEPIGIFVNLPDINQWFKQLKGKFGIYEKLKFITPPKQNIALIKAIISNPPPKNA